MSKIYLVLVSFRPENEIEWFDAIPFKAEQEALNYILKEMHITLKSLKKYHHIKGIYTKDDKYYSIKECEVK